MTTITAATPGPRPATSDAGFAVTALTVAGRTVRKFLRTPQLAVVGTLQGAIFLLIFRYVFGGAIDGGPVAYVDFMVPGFLVAGVLFSGMNAAAGVAEDLESGLFDRFRSLPVPRSAILAGRALADTVLLAGNAAVTAAFGFAVGFRIHGGAASALAALPLVVLFGFAFNWVFVCIGLFAGSAQAAQGMSLLVFPFTFVSSAYVPVESMPGWMQAFAAHQPVTAMVDAARALALGPVVESSTGSAAHAVLVALAWCALLVGVFAPLAVVGYRRR